MKLSATQIRIGLAVVKAIEGEKYHDVFLGVLTALATTIVDGAPNREQGLAAARQFAEYLQGTVEAGLDDKLASVGDLLQ
ncbi:hypothetical protein [Sinorhizobium americanum]|uniref:Uncharacterized protein n=1 Tax=Sinorhizobium americanum TaxID=194963 RepID=A0A4R2BRP4_9HYPH|nr:hypothetical protein [Sinorhizobium americanum]TCN30291.1 hypothetical protein EV184_108165 [Sinorhizobium americanum]